MTVTLALEPDRRIDEVHPVRRPGNNPKRRVAATNVLSQRERTKLAEVVRYKASGHHKRNPGDYGLERTNPRPTKSLCDNVRVVTLAEATALLKRGVTSGVFSDFRYGMFPKFIWCVDQTGEAYEARTDARNPGEYHGYRLEEDDDMRSHIVSVWKKRCRKVGK